RGRADRAPTTPRLKAGSSTNRASGPRQSAPMVPSSSALCQRVPPPLLAGFAFRPGLVRRQQLVAAPADGGDHRLVLGAELGAEAADVHVDGAGAAEEVVAPDLLEELGPGRDPARAGGQEPQQLELLVGEVEWPAPEPDRGW